ncbi:MAG: hypothetical protein AAFN74_15510, partial [Myxococcota bacterium]
IERPSSSTRHQGVERIESIIAARPIAAGEHVVRLVPGEGSYPTKSIRVRIFPGRVTKIFADFGRDRVQVLTAD